ncbi:hypothetical protein B0H14DRAFT_3448621 [Mycena olivaceomarginata]|nr:hypothetical protein B0H14DRAFT_3448621 [Mycena olivaceomarginata]
MSTRAGGHGASRGGRGRGGGQKAAAAGSKRVSPADSDYKEGPATKKTRCKAGKSDTDAAAPAASVVATMASTHERRTNAGSRMEVLVQAEKPRAKRSHDEVVASVAERVAAVEALVRQCEEAIAYVAALDVKLDAARAAEDADAIYELPPDAMDVDEGSPAHHASDEDDPMLEITQEQFDRYEDDDAYLSEPEFEKPAPKGKSVVAAVKRAKRPGKLETRRAIEAAGDALMKKKAASGMIEVKKKGVQNSDAAAASSTAGLSKTWRAKASAGPSLGGLTDEDVVAARPELQDTVKVPRGPRKNDMVGLVNASSDTEENTHQ